MHATAFSGRPGRSVRSGTAALLAGALAASAASVLATASPASAWGDGDGYGAMMKLTPRTTDELTDGRNYVRALGAADKDRWGDQFVLSFPVRSADRTSGDGYDGIRVVRLAGGVAYTGAGADVTWTRLRVNFETNRITARINGGDRAPVLRTGDGDHDWGRATWGDGDDALRLTRAGARSLNRAAAGAPFSAGDVFAGDSYGCG
jgi:hypothetical protein